MRSFFQRESESKTPSSPTPPARTAAPTAPKSTAGREATHLAQGSKVVGEISGSAELVIDGQVEGRIDLKNRVVVGGKGKVHGQIVAAAVEVSGKVDGNIRGLDRVEVHSSGSLEGDVTAPRVVIADGAFFKGKIEMTGGSKPSGSGKDTQKATAGPQPPAQTAQKPVASPAPQGQQNPPRKPNQGGGKQRRPR